MYCVVSVTVPAPAGDAVQSLVDNGVFIVHYIAPLDRAYRAGQAACPTVGGRGTVVRVSKVHAKRRERATVARVGAQAAAEPARQQPHGHGECDVRPLLRGERGVHLYSREDCPDVWVVENVEMEMENDELDASPACCCCCCSRCGT